MEGADKGETGGYCGAGYAPSGYQERQGSDGNLSQRYRPPGAVLRGGK